MKILDRYIIKKVLATFFFVMMILVAIIVVIDITEKVDKFNDKKIPFDVILGYYMDFVPWLSAMLTPIICFIAIVYVTSRLAAHTEIVAILSSGVSFRRLLVPYFLASAFIALISFVFNGWLIPHSNRNRMNFEMQYFQNKFYFESRNVHMQTAPNVYLFIQNYNNQSNTGYQFALERFSENKLMEKLTADNIQWDSVKQKWTLRFWRRKMVDQLFDVKSNADSISAVNASTHISSVDVKTSENSSATLTQAPKDPKALVPKISYNNRFAERGETVDTTLTITPKDFENNAHEYECMTIPELGHQIAQLKFRGTTGVEAYETERHIRYAAPFTTFVLVFMGVIVSARKSRGGTGFQIALGFLLAFVFILFFTMTRTFAETGSLPPAMAAWLPNSIFALISLFMYKYVPR